MPEESLRWCEDSDLAGGTFLQVRKFSGSTNTDGHVILYLRPNGLFLMTGYWPWYEHTAVAGTWEAKDKHVYLVGNGRVSTDCIDGLAVNRFERSFVIQTAHPMPTLVASDELAGWSLLGWKGRLECVGKEIIIDPDGRWLPASMMQVDQWIEKMYFLST